MGRCTPALSRFSSTMSCWQKQVGLQACRPIIDLSDGADKYIAAGLGHVSVPREGVRARGAPLASPSHLRLFWCFSSPHVLCTPRLYQSSQHRHIGWTSHHATPHLAQAASPPAKGRLPNGVLALSRHRHTMALEHPHAPKSIIAGWHRL